MPRFFRAWAAEKSGDIATVVRSAIYCGFSTIRKYTTTIAQNAG